MHSDTFRSAIWQSWKKLIPSDQQSERCVKIDRFRSTIWMYNYRFWNNINIVMPLLLYVRIFFITIVTFISLLISLCYCELIVYTHDWDLELSSSRPTDSKLMYVLPLNRWLAVRGTRNLLKMVELQHRQRNHGRSPSVRYLYVSFCHYISVNRFHNILCSSVDMTSWRPGWSRSAS